MSPVLFIRELAVFNAIWRLGLGIQWSMVVNAGVNLTALYIPLRCVAGGWCRSWRAFLGASAAFGVFAGLAMLDHASKRDSLELASPTYYSATAIGLVISIAAARAALVPGRRLIVWRVVLATIAFISTMSNPLHLLWATVPLATVLVALGARTRERVAWWTATVLIGASSLGYASRILFAGQIANDGIGYIDFSDIAISAGYYLALVGDMFASLGGAASMLSVLGLLVFAAWLTRRAWKSGDVASLMVASVGWAFPLLLILGLHRARNTRRPPAAGVMSSRSRASAVPARTRNESIARVPRSLSR